MYESFGRRKVLEFSLYVYQASHRSKECKELKTLFSFFTTLFYLFKHTCLDTSDPGVVFVSAATSYTPTVMFTFKDGVFWAVAYNIGQMNLKRNIFMVNVDHIYGLNYSYGWKK